MILVKLKISMLEEIQIMKEFDWGYRVKFNNYRNALREMKEIKFTKDGYEWIG